MFFPAGTLLWETVRVSAVPWCGGKPPDGSFQSERSAVLWMSHSAAGKLGKTTETAGRVCGSKVVILSPISLLITQNLPVKYFFTLCSLVAPSIYFQQTVSAICGWNYNKAFWRALLVFCQIHFVVNYTTCEVHKDISQILGGIIK